MLVAFFIVLFSVFFSLTTKWEIENVRKIASECYTSEFPILMYHHIRPYADFTNVSARNLSVSPEEFDKQMQYFSDKWWHTISIRDIKGNTVPCNSFLITFDDGYHDVYKYAVPILKKYGYTGIVSLIPAHIDESDYISGNQIKELLKDNWAIASHTWNHPILTKTPIEKLETEVEKSKHDLEKWFWESINTFVYPGGFYNSETLKKVAAADYKYGFTTHQGYAKLGTRNLELNRINIAPGTSPEVLEKMLENLRIKQ
jgi:peptidoglycan/xylan/chitin deacetylase (PgdA/CDA1 family)